MERKELVFEGNIIEFNIEDENVMVNATEIAKHFGKRPIDFLKLESTKLFIEELKSAIRAKRSEADALRFAGNEVSTDENIVRSDRGGDSNGVTWMHRQLALKFAAWLSPKFEVWVYQTIESVLFGPYAVIIKSIKDEELIEKEMETLKTTIEGSAEYKTYTAKMAELEAKKRTQANLRAKHVKSKIKGQGDMFE